MHRLRPQDSNAAIRAGITHEASFSCVILTGWQATGDCFARRLECQVSLCNGERSYILIYECYRVWKVGVSLLGLLTPAGPPPQRHGSQANEAYKTIDFALTSPEEAMMTAAAQLEWLTVEWPDEKRVKITIRQTALTFSVV